MQACSTVCRGLFGLPVFVGVERVWPDDERCDELLCEDELWLEPLDFAPAGAAASDAATTAVHNDKANFVFGIVTPREYESRKG